MDVDGYGNKRLTENKLQTEYKRQIYLDCVEVQRL